MVAERLYLHPLGGYRELGVNFGDRCCHRLRILQLSLMGIHRDEFKLSGDGGRNSIH